LTALFEIVVNIYVLAFPCALTVYLPTRVENRVSGQRITAPKQDAELLQVANAFSKVRKARNVLHLQFPFVHLIKFIS
jgi:hypothetical protein